MAPSLRIRLIVALVAAGAAAIVAGVVYATRQDPQQPRKLCKKLPPALIAPGVAPADARAVRAAFRLRPAAAARRLEPLANEQPRNVVVLFHQGEALECAGYLNEASQVLHRAKKLGRNTAYEISADNLLHPGFFVSGYPIFDYTGNDPLLIQGQLAQRQYHQHTAETLYAKAARLHPDDPDAQVAAAVGRFDMDDLSASFSRLGPLVQRFPRAQTVRFHLGLLSAWTGQRQLAVKEFRAALALGAGTRLGHEAQTFLTGLSASGTKPSKR